MLPKKFRPNRVSCKELCVIPEPQSPLRETIATLLTVKGDVIIAEGAALAGGELAVWMEL